MRIKLELPNDDFATLHDKVNRAEAKTENIAVPKAALAMLLRDHGRLIHAFRAEIGGNL